MLCEHCNEREARVFSTSIIEGKSSTLSLCEKCFKTHYPHEFARVQAKIEAGCRFCGRKCGSSMCGSCVAEYRRVQEAKGIRELPDASASEQDKRNYVHRMMELMEHMKKWGAERGPGPGAADEAEAAFASATRLSLLNPLFAQLAREDSRFTVEAYLFVVRALDRAANPIEGEHASGRDLALAFRSLALQEFGRNALKTLIGWGVYTTDDIGTIVYQLIAAGRFGKRPEDRIEDFHAVYDFAEAFPAD